MSKLFFRAAGWISADRGTQFRLTSEGQATLSDSELILAATVAATERSLSEKFGEGSIEVGQWALPYIHVKHPKFDPGQTELFDGVDIGEAAEKALQFAVYHPYDGRRPMDLAHWAAQGILADLDGRGGLDHLLGDLDEETRQEIVSTASAIVRRAMTTKV